MFSGIKAKLSGIKTYLVAAVAILGAVIAWQQDQISTWNALQTILAACATVTMRAAVSKAIVPPGAIVHQWTAVDGTTPPPTPPVTNFTSSNGIPGNSNPQP